MEIKLAIVLGIIVISAALGIMLNSIILVVRLVKLFHKKKISTYHFIIMQIAISDLLFAMLLSFDIQHILLGGEWKHTLAPCAFVKSTQVIAASVPGFFMFILAYERYQGIKNTVSQKWTFLGMMSMALVVWGISVASFVPYGMSIHLLKRGNNTYVSCLPGHQRLGYELYLAFLFLAVPFTLTTFFHLRIYRFVRSHAKKMSVHRQNTTSTVTGCSTTFIESESSELKTDAEEQIGIDFDRCRFDPIIESVDDDDEVFTTTPQSKVNRLRKAIQRILNVGLTLRDHMRQKILSRRNRTKSKKLKIHILLAISLCFFVCTFPNHLWFLLAHIPGYKEYVVLLQVHQVFGCFLAMHCFVNGIIYSVMDKKFRIEACLVMKSILTMKPYYRHNISRITTRHTRSVQVTSMS